MATFVSVGLKLGVIAFFIIATGHFAEARARHHRRVVTPEPIAKIASPNKKAKAEEQAKVLEEQPGFIAELGQVDAEVQVAVALYQTGHNDLAQIHMRHTDAIIYRKLNSRMTARRAVGFGTEFNDLSKGLAANEPYKRVLAKYLTLQKAIAESRGSGELLAARPMTAAVLILLRRSDEFYDSGVVNGRVVDVVQYQDAWGLMKAAKSVMNDISKAERKKHPDTLKQIDSAMADLNQLWPDLTKTELIVADPNGLLDATAKVELAGLEIK